MNEINVVTRKSEICGIIGFISSLVAISFGAGFSIAGLILCNISLNENPEHRLAEPVRLYLS